MFILIRFFTIISVLQITVLADVSKINDVQACTEFCFASNSLGSFKDGHCICESVDNKDAQNVFRESRQAEHVDPNLYSKDLTDSERIARCSLLGSRHHLRHHDADRVVKYFVNDGPSRGHSYFTGAVNANDDIETEYKTENDPLTNLNRSSDDSNDPGSEKPASELVENNFYQPDYRNPLVNAPYDPYNPINVTPMMINLQKDIVGAIYDPLLGTSNYMLSPSIYHPKSILRNRLLGSKLARKNIQPRLNPLKQFSNALLGLVREPVNEGLVGAHALLHRLTTEPDTIAYSSPYINDLSAIGRSSIGNFLSEPNPIIGINNENAQTSTVDLGSVSENNAQESFDTRKSTNLVSSVQKTNIPNSNFQNIPYNPQYFMPFYPLQNNPPGVLLHSIPRAYILQPSSLLPQAARSAQTMDMTAMPKPQDSSNYENNTSSDRKENSTDSANVTTEKSKENTDTSDSSITERDCSKEKPLKNKAKTK